MYRFIRTRFRGIQDILIGDRLAAFQDILLPGRKQRDHAPDHVAAELPGGATRDERRRQPLPLDPRERLRRDRAPFAQLLIAVEELVGIVPESIFVGDLPGFPHPGPGIRPIVPNTLPKLRPRLVRTAHIHITGPIVVVVFLE